MPDIIQYYVRIVNRKIKFFYKVIKKYLYKKMVKTDYA